MYMYIYTHYIEECVLVIRLVCRLSYTVTIIKSSQDDENKFWPKNDAKRLWMKSFKEGN